MGQVNRKSGKRPRKIRWKRVIPLCALALIVVIGGVFAGGSYINALQKPPTVKLKTASAATVATKSQASSSASSASSAPASSSETSSADSGVPVGTPPPDGVKIAYLSFDDGPSEYTPQVLNILQQNNIKATFFITFIGQDSSQKRAWLQQEAADGETIGIHSWTHDYAYIYASEQNFLTDFTQMRNVIQATIGISPKLMRFPGGVGNTVSLKYHNNVPIMPTLVNDVENMGVKPFDWTAGGEDAEIPRPASGEQFASEIMKEVGDSDHPIILMHDRYQVSVDAVPIVIQQLRAKGYSFSTLSPDMTSVTEKPVLSRK